MEKWYIESLDKCWKKFNFERTKIIKEIDDIENIENKSKKLERLKELEKLMGEAKRLTAESDMSKAGNFIHNYCPDLINNS